MLEPARARMTDAGRESGPTTATVDAHLISTKDRPRASRAFAHADDVWLPREATTLEIL
jgi:hypothetical protein